MPRLRLSLLLSLLIASPVSAVTMDWTPIGNPGNACDPQLAGPSGNPSGCFGSIAYSYSLATYEVTNAQYTEFLNAKAAADPLGLYDTHMNITRSGSSGSFTYAALASRTNNPVEYVSFYDALRFTNWLNNGQGSADTETGSYTLLGGTATPTNGPAVVRNAGATIVLPTENEWYKAAYYSPSTSSYFDFPASSDTVMTCATPTGTANRANCNSAVGGTTAKGELHGLRGPLWHVRPGRKRLRVE
jgi:formylglycine-generating enzyme required for sulfatase activity